MRPVVRLALALALGGAASTLTAAGLAQTPPPSTAPTASTTRATEPAPTSPSHLESAASSARSPLYRASLHPTAPAAATSAAGAPTEIAKLPPGQPMPGDQLQAFVDGVVGQAMARDHIAGVTVSVVQDGKIVLERGYGFAGAGRRVDPNKTLFRLASVSKTFTWITLMKDVEAGRIRLGAPVNLFLPEKLKVPDQGFKRDIMVRDLLSHSAGFEDRALGQLVEDDPAQVRPMFEYLRQERPRRVREAGSLPVYSNYGVALAGEAVSYVEGKPFQDVAEAEIFRPLAMSRTTFREPYPARADLPAPMPAALAADLSPGYRWSDGQLEPQATEFMTQVAPAAAASSTAGDMARYMLMVLGDGQLEGATIYGPETARGFRSTLQTGFPGVAGWDDGFKEFALPGFRGVGHEGDTLWFHSAMVTVPTLNLGVFVAANTDTAGGLTSQLPSQIVGHFYGPETPEPPPPSSSLSANARAYEGTYLDNRRPFGGLGKFAQMLSAEMKVAVTNDGRLLTSQGGETHAWWPKGDGGLFGAVDSPDVSAFQMEEGQAVRWFAPAGDTSYDRVGPLQQIPTLAILAILTFLASAATLGGQFLRDPREFRQTTSQSRAHLLQASTATLWLVMFTNAAAWRIRAPDHAALMLRWPGAFLLIASACALVATVMTLVTVIMLPWVWRGGRRLDSWTGGRKLAFTITSLIFLGFSVVLGLWGALEPWSR